MAESFRRTRFRSVPALLVAKMRMVSFHGVRRISRRHMRQGLTMPPSSPRTTRTRSSDSSRELRTGSPAPEEHGQRPGDRDMFSQNRSEALDFDAVFALARPAGHAMSIPFAFPGPTNSPLSGLHCAGATIDDHGRLSNRSTVRALGWEPGQHVVFGGDHRMIVVGCARRSRWSVSRSGYLRVPAASRHRCNVNPGDRFLVAADTDRDLLAVVPSAVLGAALWAHLSDIWRLPS